MYQFALAETRAVNEIKKDVLDATKTLLTPQRGFTPDRPYCRFSATGHKKVLP